MENVVLNERYSRRFSIYLLLHPETQSDAKSRWDYGHSAVSSGLTPAGWIGQEEARWLSNVIFWQRACF